MARPGAHGTNAGDDVQLIGHILLIETPPGVQADQDSAGTFLSEFVAGQDLVLDCDTDSLYNPVDSVRACCASRRGMRTTQSHSGHLHR